VKSKFRSLVNKFAASLSPNNSLKQKESGVARPHCFIGLYGPIPAVLFPALLVLLAGFQPAMAQTTILSTVPVNGASGVSPSAPVIFTFSAAMKPAATIASFYDLTAGFQSTPVISVWSSGNTVLTCTPSPQFANNHTIQWQVAGQDALGNPLTGATTGTFTNVAGVGGGSGTNSFTSILFGKYWIYGQISAAPPVLQPAIPYEFFAQTLLSSNRSATNVTVTIPVTGVVTNLAESPLAPERFSFTVFKTNQTALDTNFPTGNYTFNINAASSNQQLTVTLPAFAQPNAPQVLNYTAAQSINPALPFTVFWNTFTNGGSTDWIFFLIGGGNGGTLFATPLYSQPGFLPGTATSATIPAGTLQAGTNYIANIAFYHLNLATNNGLVNAAFIGTLTQFALSTASNASSPPLLNIARSGTNVVLSWPTNAAGFHIEAASTLVSPAWNTNFPAPAIVGTNNVLTNGASGSPQFFRLVNP
jgi:hypothetical protein